MSPRRAWALSARVFLLWLALAFGGCAADVLVVEESGAPVEGAHVTGALPSFDVWAYTDDDGEASFWFWNARGFIHVAVTCAGFEPSYVRLPMGEDRPLPIRVTLKRRPKNP